MPRLTVLSDPIKCERTEYALRVGETLAHALMRLWPQGVDGSWRLYRDTVAEDNEIAATEMPYTPVLKGDSYLLVRDMAGAAFTAVKIAAFLQNVLAAFVFNTIIAAITPKPPRHRPDDPDRISSNNLIAGQSNQLRPGSRVPDLLGRVRAYPDLLCAPVDVYNETSQTIGQMFVLGVGSYDVPDATKKLGETPIDRLANADLDVYQPGVTVPPFYVLKASREVGDVSLLLEKTGATEVSGEADFNAAAKTMTLDETIPVGANLPMTISGTFFNDFAYWVDAVPANTQTTPPFVYVLYGPVSDELGANPSFSKAKEAIQMSSAAFWFGNATAINWPTTAPPHDQTVQFQYTWPGTDQQPKVGQLLELRTGANRWRGRISNVVRNQAGRVQVWGLTMRDLWGNPMTFPSLSRVSATYHSWDEVTSSGGGTAPPPPGGLTNEPTDWFAVPMRDAAEIWIDIAFPQGLAWWDHGSRRSLEVVVAAEFRRVGAVDADIRAVNPPFSFFYGTAAALRFTKRVSVASLNLPPGDDLIEVRLTRTTAFYADSSNNQYVQDTRWVRLAAVKQLIGQKYPKCTVMAFSMSNNRSTAAVGDMALNVMATRILPTWTGTGWSTPAPTSKWADNFVARVKATDGAHRTDEQIDLAGIYALQHDVLDHLDAGKQGEISMTLDQVQDIDAELAAIADVARSVVYRVGKKIFVSRDQANATTIALFNARTKGPEGETIAVRMTGDADNDCVIVTWVDEQLGFKQRDFRYPDTDDVLGLNPLRVGAVCANWEQAWRRAVFEWNKLKYRRKQLSVSVTEDGRICRPGDVINITDDIATLATCAGEVIKVDGAVLTLDRDLILGAGTAFTILLRDNAGIHVDLIPCTPTGGATNQVTLARSPTVAIRGRDAAMGTMFAFYPSDASPVYPWLVLGLESAGPYVTINATNYTDKAYAGDTAAIPPRPPAPGALPEPPPPPVIPPSPVAISDLSVKNYDTGSVSCVYQLTSGGDVMANNGDSFVVDRGDWLSPKTGMSDHSVRVTPQSGTSPDGDAVNTWLNLGTPRQWGLSGSGFNYGSFLVEIRLDATGTIEDTAIISMGIH